MIVDVGALTTDVNTRGGLQMPLPALSAGWKEYEDDAGETFFFHAATDKYSRVPFHPPAASRDPGHRFQAGFTHAFFPTLCPRLLTLIPGSH